MGRLTVKFQNGYLLQQPKSEDALLSYISAIADKLGRYEDMEEQGRLIKLPGQKEKDGYKECAHKETAFQRIGSKCFGCPLTEVLCAEFYSAIDRCCEDAYASGRLAGIREGRSEAGLEGPGDGGPKYEKLMERKESGGE